MERSLRPRSSGVQGVQEGNERACRRWWGEAPEKPNGLAGFSGSHTCVDSEPESAPSRGICRATGIELQRPGMGSAGIEA